MDWTTDPFIIAVYRDGKIEYNPNWDSYNCRWINTPTRSVWHSTNKWPNAAEGYELYEGPVPDGAYERMVRQD